MELHAGEKNRSCLPEIHLVQMYCYGGGILTSGRYKRLNNAPVCMQCGTLKYACVQMTCGQQLQISKHKKNSA